MAVVLRIWRSGLCQYTPSPLVVTFRRMFIKTSTRTIRQRSVHGTSDKIYTEEKFSADQRIIAKHEAPITATSVDTHHTWDNAIASVARSFINNQIEYTSALLTAILNAAFGVFCTVFNAT